MFSVDIVQSKLQELMKQLGELKSAKVEMQRVIKVNKQNIPQDDTIIEEVSEE